MTTPVTCDLNRSMSECSAMPPVYNPTTNVATNVTRSTQPKTFFGGDVRCALNERAKVPKSFRHFRVMALVINKINHLRSHHAILHNTDYANDCRVTNLRN